jgi:hypothetical protein
MYEIHAHLVEIRMRRINFLSSPRKLTTERLSGKDCNVQGHYTMFKIELENTTTLREKAN